MTKKKVYQKDINVKRHIITKEWKPLWKMLHLLPKELKIFELACAEGFPVWMAKKRGFSAKGMEIHKDKVVRGRQHLSLGTDILHGDVFKHLKLLDKANCFIVCRFFHNVGLDASVQLMNRINDHKDYIVIAKYKPGKLKETGKPRQPLAMKKGLANLLKQYDLNTMSFQQEFIVGAKGKYKDIPNMLREHLPEPV